MSATRWDPLLVNRQTLSLLPTLEMTRLGRMDRAVSSRFEASGRLVPHGLAGDTLSGTMKPQDPDPGLHLVAGAGFELATFGLWATRPGLFCRKRAWPPGP